MLKVKYVLKPWEIPSVINSKLPVNLTHFRYMYIRMLLFYFWRLGLLVAKHPLITIVLSLLVCGLCGIGLTKFEQTTDDAKLWVPKSSRVLEEKAWMDTNFPEKYRFTSVIVTAHNVLSPLAINSVWILFFSCST